jgi:hypothetical protein
VAGALLPGANKAMADISLFSDDFTGPSLNAAWQVQSGNGAYSLNGGDLRYVNQGFGSSPSGWYSTSEALFVPFTGTDWELDTKATYNLGYLDNLGQSSGAQRSTLIVSFDQISTYNSVASFERGVDAWYGENRMSAGVGAIATSNLLNPADATINNNVAGGTYWYQIIRHGGDLTMNYSYDGINYFNALSTVLVDPSNPYNELLLTGTIIAT